MASTIASSYVSVPARDVWDLVVVGGGPAGLATAIVAAERGLSVAVIERRDFPADKACGEGILPPGVKALTHLGIAGRFDCTNSFPFAGIRFIQEDGSSAESRMPTKGLGIRRTVLVHALAHRAENSAQFCVIDARSTTLRQSQMRRSSTLARRSAWPPRRSGGWTPFVAAKGVGSRSACGPSAPIRIAPALPASALD